MKRKKRTDVNEKKEVKISWFLIIIVPLIALLTSPFWFPIAIEIFEAVLGLLLFFPLLLIMWILSAF